MALFLNQNERRSQLQEKIAAELSDRANSRRLDQKTDVGGGILQDSQEASHHSLAWVGVVTVAVIALVIVVLLIYDGV